MFDEIFDQRGTGSVKWDGMVSMCGVPADDGLAMWVADMDFQPPQAARDALEAFVRRGFFTYFNGYQSYHDAIQWWQRERHGWNVDPDCIFTTHGICNGLSLALEAYTRPGDEIILFTPVYHAFARVIRACGRVVRELPLALQDGQFVMDFDRYGPLLSGRERMVISCSPHNPGGRVWSHEELTRLAQFVQSHDLLLISDEIHQDLVYPDAPRHIPMPVAAPEIIDRMLVMSAASKTFNIAGLHTGQVYVEDKTLRGAFKDKMSAMSIAPNMLGVVMTEAVYSPAGAAWVDELMVYIDRNRSEFTTRINAIPGLTAMPMEGTYLAWVDFANTGMAPDEFTKRVRDHARIATNLGTAFGSGGETYLRFNIGTQHARVDDALTRLEAAFSDLQ